MTPHRIATALDEARKAAGLTLRQLADKAGVSISTLWQLGSGRNTPRLDTADRIAHALGYELQLVKRSVTRGEVA